MFCRGKRLEQDSVIWFEYRPMNNDEWCTKLFQPKRKYFGPSFVTRCGFDKGTHWQTVKRWYWERYKYDIDKIPEFERMVVKYCEQSFVT